MPSSWEKRFMRAALEFAEESKCAAKKVSCIIVKDNSIIAIGVNGTAPKTMNCCDKFRKVEGKWFTSFEMHESITKYNDGFIEDNKYWRLCEDQREHYHWSLKHETHAEINALSRAGTGARGAVAYVTHSPCMDCAKALGAFGIVKVYYYEEFDDLQSSIETLKHYGASMEQLEI